MRFPALALTALTAVTAALAACQSRSSPAGATSDASSPVLAAATDAAPSDGGLPGHALVQTPRLPLPVQVRMKIQDARDAFPSPSTPIRVRVLRDAFVLVGVGAGDYFDHAVDFVDRTLTAYYNHRFQNAPPYAVLVYFFKRFDDYEAYVEPAFHIEAKKFYGVYGTYTHVAAVDGSGGLPYLPTLAHELAHPLIDGDLGPPGVPGGPRGRPEWAAECISSLFEAPVFPAPGEIRGEYNWRFPKVLHPALHPPDGGPPAAVSLDALFHMDDDTFLAKRPDGGVDDHTQDLNYAVSRSLCYWLDRQGKLWPWVAQWRSHRAEDPTGQDAFTAVMGQTPAQADGAWRQWIDRL